MIRRLKRITINYDKNLANVDYLDDVKINFC